MKKVKGPGEEYAVDLVETLFANLDITQYEEKIKKEEKESGM